MPVFHSWNLPFSGNGTFARDTNVSSIFALIASFGISLSSGNTRSSLPGSGLNSAESFTGVSLYGGGDHMAVALADGRIRLWGPAGAA